MPGSAHGPTLGNEYGKPLPFNYDKRIQFVHKDELAPYGTNGRLLLRLLPTSKSKTRTKIKNPAPISFRYCALF